MVAFYGVFLVLVIIQVAIIFGQHGLGFMGCYPPGRYLQNVFDTGSAEFESTSVDDCVGNCSIAGTTYAAISEITCFCSDGFPETPASGNDQCNTACLGNLNQFCGSRTHYSFYNTSGHHCSPLDTPGNGTIIQYRLVVGSIATFRCFPSFELIGNSSIRCTGYEEGSKEPSWSAPVPKCVFKRTEANATQGKTNASTMVTADITVEFSMTTGPSATRDNTGEGHIRHIIAIGSGLAGLCFIVLIIYAIITLVKRKRRHDLTAVDGVWVQPKNLGQRINVPSSLSLSGVRSTDVRGESMSNKYFTRSPTEDSPYTDNEGTTMSNEGTTMSNEGTVSSSLEDKTYINLRKASLKTKVKASLSNPIKSKRLSRNFPQAEENYVNYVPKRGRINRR